METSKSRMKWIVAACSLIVTVLLYGGYSTLMKRPALDAAVIAKAETAMWRAYYERDDKALAWNLVHLMRSQYGLNWWEAGTIGYLFADSAMKFRNGEVSHTSEVLPELIEAYRKINATTSINFDPVKAAKAEWSWWIARRSNRHNSPQNVGKQIASLYQILYGQDHPAFQESGLLRAQAANLRDQGKHNADWKTIETMLTESYTTLIDAVQDSENVVSS